MENLPDLNKFSEACHAANAKWWLDLEKPCTACLSGCIQCEYTGYQRKERNVGELIALCHSELSEALEGHRKNLQDDKLPHRKMLEVELADLLIRVFDLCGGLNLDIDGAFQEKMEYNAKRADHTIAGRLAEGGKKY